MTSELPPPPPTQAPVAGPDVPPPPPPTQAPVAGPNVPPPPTDGYRPRRPWEWGAAGLAAAAVIAVGVALTGGTDGGGGPSGLPVYGATLADPAPYDGRSPALAPGETERVLVELPRPALAARRNAGTLTAKQQRAYVASLRDEAASLISALAARDVRLEDVVTFERTFHGFAATVDAKDFPRLQSIGVRVRPNRRFFPAFSEPVPAGEAPEGAAVDAEVTVLAGGVSGAEGYDAVDDDDDPAPGVDPRDPDRREVGGEPLAAALEALGAEPRVIRVSGLQDGEEFARTDTLLAGLERTVDPDGDGDTTDHDAVALIGVSAPYAGFADAPESVAVRGAEALGTLIVAPAGQDGAAEGAYGTIGSPGAAAIAVEGVSPAAAVARTTLQIGDATVTGAAVLAGTPPTGPLASTRPVAANTTAALLVANSPPLKDTLAVVEAGLNPGARVAAAAGAGAAAVLLAEARPDRPLPVLPAGRVGVPVIGVTGEAASAALAAAAEGAQARAVGLTAPRPPFETGTPSRFASEGPAYDGTPKPELTRPGTIVAGGSLISGAAVAAARVAVEAATQDATRADLVGPPDTQAPDPAPAPDVPVEGLTVDAARGATSVQFTLGSFSRGDPTAGAPGAGVVPAETLVLTLTRDGDETPVERLTPPGGQRGLLPGAYAFTLPKALVGDLAKGSYVFRVEAAAPRQTEPTVAVSPPFDAP